MNKFVIGGVVVAILLGVVGIAKDTKVVQTVVEKDGVQVGAVTPFSPTPELNLGGLRLVGLKKPLATGTSTVCAIQSPTATSTLLTGGVQFTLASTSAVTFELSKGTTQFATSTRIGTLYGVGASAQATIVASSTGSVAGDGTIFAPSTWFIGKFLDVNNGTGNASTGQCWATWAVTS
jgi:hypothetical protein